MKLTLQLQLLPAPDQRPILLATMERFNEAATFAAKLRSMPASSRSPASQAGLSRDQGAVRTLGSDGGPSDRQGSRVFKRDKTRCPVFKTRSAICYDNRILGFKGLDKVSLWALGGRIILPLVYGEYQGERYDRMEGQLDLVDRGGKFFLYCTVEMPENAPIVPTDFLGVDLGIVNIAVDSDSGTHSGEAVKKIRRKRHRNRKAIEHPLAGG